MDLDPVLVSLNLLRDQAQNNHTPSDVKDAIEKTLEILDKKEKYWLKHMPDTPNAQRIFEKTLLISWDQLYNEGKTLYRCDTVWMGSVGQAPVLQFLIRMQKAKRVLEIGMFTGYVTMAIAECLPEDDIVVTCEIDPYLVENGRKEFDKGPFGRKIDIRQGPAAASLVKLASEGQQFDFVYLDADKGGYLNYFEKMLDKGLLALGGTLAVDNTFGIGCTYTKPHENAVDEFNRAVTADHRVDQVLLPLFDGLTLIRRKGE